MNGGGAFDRWTGIGVAMLAALYALLLASPAYETASSAAEDVALALTRPAVTSGAVVVVDIDRATLAEVGPWPWSRDRLAGVVAALADAGPQALGLDILVDGADERSPAALARTLGRIGQRPEIAALAERLPDGDALLIAALQRAPSILGVALDPDGLGNDPPTPQMLVANGGLPDGLWQASGAIGPPAPIASAAAGLGVLALPGDGDARIRNVPLLVEAGGGLRPGFAAEVVRVAAGVGAYVVDGRNRRLRLGSRRFSLAAQGGLRLRPPVPELHAARTVAARDVVAGDAARNRLRGAIVLLGSSAPEVGGLRPVASGDLVATVQLQADAVEQMLAGDQPHRAHGLPVIEWIVAALMAAVAAHAAARRPPLPAAGITALLIFGWLLAAYAALDVRQILADFLAPVLAVLLGYGASALWTASRMRLREAAIRRRFEQQLPPPVVRRLLEEPGLLKLEGEARVVTALFTDIEGFTAMTERAGPRRLVAMLDRYFEGVVRIVVEHGGMVEKIVGDGLHAIFNAPVDLEDHAAKAFDCARAISAFAEQFRTEGDPAALGFGRTRIGIETGEVVVGDVGGGRRLDYTAHGDAMNTAARLEAANKDLGSTICIGPGAAAGIAADLLRPLARLSVRGRAEPLTVFEPWPAAMTPGERADFLAADAAAAADPARAIRLLAPLAAHYPGDASLALKLAALTRRCATPP